MLLSTSGSDMMKIPNLKEAAKRTKGAVCTANFELPDSLNELGLNKRFFIRTYGCQMNIHDSEKIKAILESMSFKETETMGEADLIIINTCAIRENAHDKVFGFLGRVKHLKSKKPSLVTVVCGCMAQEEVVVEVIMNKYTWINLVFGTHNIHRLPFLLEKVFCNENQEIEVLSIEGDIIEKMPVKRDSKYKAWVNIMLGCDKFCTYCIVPYVRGKQRSRSPKDIIEEVETLLKEGYQEVTLLGQNVNAYGKDLNNDYAMGDLLEDIAKTGMPRIRFMTSHPWDFNDKMIAAIKNNDNVMPAVHLPIQSGSNRILKLMGRRYTKESYIELVKTLKAEIPNLALTTDIIVGFPSETEDDFKESVNIVHQCKYDSAFTFLFSPRDGTPAAKMEDNLTLEEKNKRLYYLNDIVNGYANDNNQKYKDTVVQVLIEGKGAKRKLMGYTETMKLVNVDGDESNIGKIVPVVITEVKTWSMNGKIL